jgi:diguanylate cyclase (GGDEF)-like protein
MAHFLLHDHDPILVFLALGMCVIGALVTVRLWRAALAAQGARKTRLEWCFLAGVAGGASIWSTHFIAMLGYRPHTAASFDPELTILSIAVAVLGVFASLAAATERSRIVAFGLGGPSLGLSIALMHYVGMAAYDVAGTVTWDAGLVALSVLLSVAFATVAVAAIRALSGRRQVVVPMAALVTAILTLHLVGMAALSVGAVHGEAAATAGEFNAVALATFLCGLLVVGMGFCTDTINNRAHLQTEQRLMHQARTDSLTGLPNRRHFQERLVHHFDGTSGASLAIMLLDLDRFKAVNDTLGHHVGDALLRRVGARLDALIGERGLCARIGGDEFAILVPGAGDLAELRRLADMLIEIVSRPYVIDGNVADVGASIGIAIAPEHGDASEPLVQNADVALYAAKEAGRGRCCVFEPGMMTAAQARKALEADLRRALARNEFTLYYQPLTDPVTGGYTGAEALLRWQHPERGSVSPAVFIPLAEELGLIVSIGEWVLHEACTTAVSWPETMRIAVNVSPVQMASPRFPELVFETLDLTGLPPTRLELEITETTLLKDDGRIEAMLREFSSAGISIALDDFGTGYSSLTSLHRYPINRIKIDRSFMAVSDEDSGARDMVRAISKLGQILGVSVTAEGIETGSQYSFAAECGCGPMQGYYIGRPVPRAELPEYFRSRRPIAA